MPTILCHTPHSHRQCGSFGSSSWRRRFSRWSIDARFQSHWNTPNSAFSFASLTSSYKYTQWYFYLFVEVLRHCVRAPPTFLCDGAAVVGKWAGDAAHLRRRVTIGHKAGTTRKIAQLLSSPHLFLTTTVRCLPEEAKDSTSAQF